MAVVAGEFATASRIMDELGMSVSDTQLTSGTTTSTTYTATLTGGTACGVAFTAPASGVVIIINNGWSNNGSSASQAASTSIQIRTGASVGSGTIVLAASDDNSIAIWGVNATSGSWANRVTGLTAGNSYNIQQLFRVTGGGVTGSFLRKHLIVKSTI